MKATEDLDCGRGGDGKAIVQVPGRVPLARRKPTGKTSSSGTTKDLHQHSMKTNIKKTKQEGEEGMAASQTCHLPHVFVD